jgi:hypothetical protein
LNKESESSDREEVETGEMAANTLLRTHTPDKFEQQKQLKLLLDRGKEIFRLHPKKVCPNESMIFISVNQNLFNKYIEF